MIWWYWVLLIVVAAFAAGAIFGAPYLPIRRQDSAAALKLAGVKPGQLVLDLGSGDGRQLVAAAKLGAKAIGYEINPFLYLYSLLVCWPYRKQITVKLGDYWHAKLPEADVIFVFLITRYMNKLDAKLVKELQKPTTVVSYVFELPREPVKKTNNTFVYRYP